MSALRDVLERWWADHCTVCPEEVYSHDRYLRAKAELANLEEQGESWRTAARAWQGWANELLGELGRNPLIGRHEDGPAREAIAQLAGMAPGVPRCLRCGCFSTRHEAAPNGVLWACVDCECEGFEDPSRAAPAPVAPSAPCTHEHARGGVCTCGAVARWFCGAREPRGIQCSGEPGHDKSGEKHWIALFVSEPPDSYHVYWSDPEEP